MEKQNNSHAFTPEQVAAILNPCPPMFTDRGKVGCTTSPTFKPTEFFEHIKHWLDRLSAEKIGGNIMLSYRDSKTGVFKAWIQVSREPGGLAVFVTDAQNYRSRICSLEQLDAFLLDNVYDPIAELESLLGLDKRTGGEDSMRYDAVLKPTFTPEASDIHPFL